MMPRMVIPVAGLAPFASLVFLTVANFASLPQQFRLATMASIVGLLGLSVFAKISISLRPSTFTYLIFIFIFTSLAIYHNSRYPSLTEFADTKRTYFFFAFIGCGLIIPMAMRNVDNLTYLTTCLIIFSVLFSFLAFTNGDTLNSRRSGIDLNPAMHSKLLFFPGLMLLAYGSKVTRHRALVVATLLGVAGCMATGSRGAIVIFIATLLVDRLKDASPKEAARAMALLLLLAAAFFIILGFLPASITERFTIVSLASQSDEGDRLFLYDLGLRLFLDALTGIGMGNFSAYFWVAAPHNIVIEVMVELGVWVGSLFVLMLFLTGLRALRHIRSEEPIARFYGLFFIFMIGNSMIGGEMSFSSFILYMSMGILWLSDLINPTVTLTLKEPPMDTGRLS